MKLVATSIAKISCEVKLTALALTFAYRTLVRMAHLHKGPPALATQNSWCLLPAGHSLMRIKNALLVLASSAGMESRETMTVPATSVLATKIKFVGMDLNEMRIAPALIAPLESAGTVLLQTP